MSATPRHPDPPSPDAIAANLADIRARMSQAAERAGREPRTVRLVAVSKTKPAAAVLAAAAAGQMIFGENRIQEARDKAPQVQAARAADDPALQWHLIGPLQRNKVKYAVGLFDLIHSVDSVALAEALGRRLLSHPPAGAGQAAPLPILMQINIGREAQKHGFDPQEAEAALEALSQLPGVAVRGLMAIPPFEPNPEDVRPHFRALADLARRLAGLGLPGVSLGELSMGMSHDFEPAIEEGATLVRVGSALFGARPKP